MGKWKRYEFLIKLRMHFKVRSVNVLALTFQHQEFFFVLMDYNYFGSLFIISLSRTPLLNICSPPAARYITWELRMRWKQFKKSIKVHASVIYLPMAKVHFGVNASKWRYIPHARISTHLYHLLESRSRDACKCSSLWWSVSCIRGLGSIPPPCDPT